MVDNRREHNELNQYLTFVLDDEEYGVPILSVRGIQGWEKTTPIPNSPEYIMGIINLRGEIVPIVDLRKRFNLESIPYSTHTVVIVVRVGQDDKQQTVGLVVDAVADVHNIEDDDIHNSPDFGEKASMEFVKGLGLIGKKMVIILEIDQLSNWETLLPDGQEAADSSDLKQTVEVEPENAEAA